MSVPGYTAELSLRRANGHYRTAFTSPHVQGMARARNGRATDDGCVHVHPRVGAGVRLQGSWDPYGSSIGSPTLSDTIKCMRECAFTLSSCKREWSGIGFSVPSAADTADATPPPSPFRSMQTGQNSIAPENSLPQLGQMRWCSLRVAK